MSDEPSANWYEDDDALVDVLRRAMPTRPVPSIHGYDDLIEIGRGGQGVVYAAVQRSTKRRVAIKVILEGILAAPSARHRFEREIEAVASLAHPNIVRVYDSGATGDGHLYYVMEFIEGKPLDEYVRDRSVDDVLDLMATVARAVGHAHQRAIIHRDLKPENIRIDAQGQPHILDFGLARALGGAAGGAAHPTLSIAGQFLGSLPWSSPEHAGGQPHDIDVRSDVYCLGLITYQALTGRMPYDVSGSVHQILDRVAHAEPTRPSRLRTEVTGDLEAVIFKALDKNPDRRYQTASALADDIERYRRGEPVEARGYSVAAQLGRLASRYRWQMGVAVLLVLLLATAAILSLIATSNTRLTAERERADQIAYGGMINAAEAAIRMNDVANARVLLERAAGERAGWEHRHLMTRLDQSLQAADGLTLTGGHHDLAFSPGTSRLAVVHHDAGAIVVYDVSTDGRIDTGAATTLQLDRPTAVAFSPGGRVLAAGAEDGRIGAWDLSRGTRPMVIFDASPPISAISALAIDSAGESLVSGHHDGSIRVWRIADAGGTSMAGEPLVIDAHDALVQSVVFGPGGTILASASDDHSVRLWAGDGTALAELRGHDDRVMDLELTPDCEVLASASIDGTIRLWDVPASIEARRAGGSAAGIELGVLDARAGGVREIALGPGARTLISGGADATLRVWAIDLAPAVLEHVDQPRRARPRQRLLAVLRGHRTPIDALTVSDGGLIASAADDGAVKLWDAAIAEAQIDNPLILQGHGTSVNDVAWIDEQHLASCAGQDGIAVWDASLGRCLAQRRIGSWFAEAIAAARAPVDGKRDRPVLVIVSGAEGTIEADQPLGRLVLVDLGEPAHPRLVMDGAWEAWPSRLCTVAATRDGALVAVGDEAGSIRVFAVGEGPVLAPVAPMSGPQEHVAGLAFLDEHGTHLASIAGASKSSPPGDFAVRIWDVRSERCIHELFVNGAPLTGLAVSPDGRLLAAGAQNGMIEVWHVRGDPPRLEKHYSLIGHGDWIDGLAFHPTEGRLASASRDRTIRIWETRLGVEVATLHGQLGGVRGVAFDASGARLVSASSGYQGTDNALWIWETEADRQKQLDVARERVRCRLGDGAGLPAAGAMER